MTDSIYIDFIETKTNSIIPVFKSGKTVESKYNPERECDNIISNIDKIYSVFLVTGISSGILLSKIADTFPDSIIIGLEISEDDINFLKKNDFIFQKISNNRIHLTSLSNLENVLLNVYIPAKHGDLKIIEQKNWITENLDKVDTIKNTISNSISKISADYSVQSHFGKIWTKNILNNIKHLSSMHSKTDLLDKIDISKNAYIIAAGPTLDKTIEVVKKDNNKYVIATDTAFQVLQKYNIIPDCVVSIDGQGISHNHFYKAGNFSTTLFLFDLAGNSSAAKYIYQNNLIYFISGHPLCTLFNLFYDNSLISLYSGSGTVTITALDFAVSMGFNNIKVLGADFSYSSGKAYTKGSYLDLLYNMNSNKTCSSEKTFDNLLYRTPLQIVHENRFTTTLLDSYKTSLLQYLKQKNCIFSFHNDIYDITNNNSKSLKTSFKEFKYEDFIKYLNTSSSESLETALLPLIAYLRQHNSDNNMNTFSDFVKLAHSFIVRYN